MKIDVFENLNIYISKQLQSLDNLKIKTIKFKKIFIKIRKEYNVKIYNKWEDGEYMKIENIIYKYNEKNKR
jgi:hypothetical protein